MEITTLTLLTALLQAQAPAAPPSTDVFVAPLSITGGKVTVGPAENMSKSPGYDNQPFFTPDGAAILFTSDRSRVVSAPLEGVAPPPPQTDIYRYDLASKAVAQVTDTVLREYSPTVTPDGGISVIRVEDDGTQRLWRFTMAGKEPAVVLKDVKPVGYHAWLNDRTLALFVLGTRPKPATLQIADVPSGNANVVAEDIGQSVQPIPGGGVSFVQREAGPAGTPAIFTIKRVRMMAGADGRPFSVDTLIHAVPGSTSPHLAWTPDGLLLMAHAGTLYGWRVGEKDWTPVADLAALGLKNVTRLAVSPKGTWIAFVSEPK